MLVFLIITSLSLAFYLGLLVVLHRDGRKRRVNPGHVRKVDLGTVAELSTVGLQSTATVAIGRRDRSTIFVHLGKTSRRQMRKPRTTAGEPAEVITLPKLGHSKNDLQCG
jgi:hypothetical protein